MQTWAEARLQKTPSPPRPPPLPATPQDPPGHSAAGRRESQSPRESRGRPRGLAKAGLPHKQEGSGRSSCPSSPSLQSPCPGTEGVSRRKERLFAIQSPRGKRRRKEKVTSSPTHTTPQEAEDMPSPPLRDNAWRPGPVSGPASEMLHAWPLALPRDLAAAGAVHLVR